MKINNSDKAKELQTILDKITDNKTIFGTSFAIKKDEFVWQGATGNLLDISPISLPAPLSYLPQLLF